MFTKGGICRQPHTHCTISSLPKPTSFPRSLRYLGSMCKIFYTQVRYLMADCRSGAIDWRYYIPIPQYLFSLQPGNNSSADSGTIVVVFLSQNAGGDSQFSVFDKAYRLVTFVEMKTSGSRRSLGHDSFLKLTSLIHLRKRHVVSSFVDLFVCIHSNLSILCFVFAASHCFFVSFNCSLKQSTARPFVFPEAIWWELCVVLALGWNVHWRTSLAPLGADVDVSRRF